MSGIQNLLLGGSPVAAAAEDPDFEYVTLLLPGNGTNGAQNNTFLDSSTNNFTITRNGNTTQGTFSPFSQTGWSNYFDGTGDYITVGYTSAFAPNTYVSLECWVFFNSLASDTLIVGRQGMWLNYSYTGIGATSNKIAFSIYDGSSWYAANSSTTPSVGQWYHIVGVRDNTTLRIYINGVQEGTAAFSVSPAAFSTDFAIGGSFTGSNYVTGYISNVRYCNGSTSGALPYTGSSFTVPTSILTSTGSTVLLTCQSNRFIDNSSNAFAITVNGNTSVQPFSPFEPSAAWSASTNGGSGYFDGTGDYLSVAGNTAFAFGTGDFSIEFWYYWNSITGYQTVYNNNYVSANNILIQTGNGDGKFRIFVNDSNATLTETNAATTGQWYFYQFVRSSGTLTIYRNGVSNGSVANSASAGTSGAALNIGEGNGNYYLNGWLSSFRIIKGSASAATVPTAPLTNITNTSLLCNFTNAGIYDAAAMNDLETVGNAQISTAQSKFGGSSMYFDGTGDYLVSNAATTDLYAFGTGDFTIEAWVYFSAFTAANIFYDGRPASTNGAQPTIYGNSSGNLVYFANGGNQIQAGASAITTATWYHVAVARSGTSTKMFLDGTQVGSTYTDSTNYTNTSGRPVIGVDGNSGNSNYFNGYINGLRVTKGVARYTANFTPPTAAFPLF